MASLKYIWLGVLLVVGATTALWPTLDLAVTAAFFSDGKFPARSLFLPNAIHDLATEWPPKALFAVLVIGLLANCRAWRLTLPWVFLIGCLLLGPGLVANVLCKDMWGRARPVQIVEFGGRASFTPYWLPSDQCAKNCSFVNGDGSLGFIFAAPALVITRYRRWLFWGGTTAGVVLGGNRIIMGAHFLSDTVWAALLMLAVMLVLHASVYGRAKTIEVWRSL